MTLRSDLIWYDNHLSVLSEITGKTGIVGIASVAINGKCVAGLAIMIT